MSGCFFSHKLYTTISIWVPMQLCCAPPQVSSALPIEIVVKMAATISMKLRNEGTLTNSGLFKSSFWGLNYKTFYCHEPYSNSEFFSQLTPSLLCAD